MDPKSNGTQVEPSNQADSASSNSGTDQGGEGNYDASRRYREGLERSVEKGDADELAEKAKKALDGPEGEALRKAEERGKQGAHKNVSK
jgi:hypothetical protein